MYTVEINTLLSTKEEKHKGKKTKNKPEDSRNIHLFQARQADKMLPYGRWECQYKKLPKKYFYRKAITSSGQREMIGQLRALSRCSRDHIVSGPKICSWCVELSGLDVSLAQSWQRPMRGKLPRWLSSFEGAHVMRHKNWHDGLPATRSQSTPGRNDWWHVKKKLWLSSSPKLGEKIRLIALEFDERTQLDSGRPMTHIWLWRVTFAGHLEESLVVCPCDGSCHEHSPPKMNPDDTRLVKIQHPNLPFPFTAYKIYFTKRRRLNCLRDGGRGGGATKHPIMSLVKLQLYWGGSVATD